MRLGKNQKAVLKKAVVGNDSALVTFEMAKAVYGNNSDAKSCLRSLSGKGILKEIGSNGARYKITNLPEDLYMEWVE